MRAGLDALRINPLRTALSTLGIVVGVASLVAVLSLGDGTENYLRDQVEQTTGVQTIIVSSVTSRQVDGVWLPMDRYPIFTADDAHEATREIPGVASASVTVSGPVLFTQVGGGGHQGGTVVGALTSAIDFEGLDLEYGRFFSVSEERRSANVAVLSDSLARVLAYPRETATLLGERVRIGRATHRIVGVFAPPELGEDDAYAYVPLSTVAAAMQPTGQPPAPTFLLKAHDVESVEPLRIAIEDWLAVRYGPWDGRIRVATSQGRLQQIQSGLAIVKAIMGAIVGISLIVGGIGIMNVLLASVAERTREIGVRKAMGARQRDIHLQFLAESIAIAMVGSVAGAVVGVAGAYLITGILRWTLEAELYAGLSWSTPMFAIGSAMLVGLVFGTYPARHAAGLSPIDAIRHE